MPEDEQQMTRGSSVAGSLGAVPLVVFMSEQEKVIAARLSEIRNSEDIRWQEHKEFHDLEAELRQRALIDRIAARETEEALRWRSHQELHVADDRVDDGYRSAHAQAHIVEREERDKAVTSVNHRLTEMNHLRDQNNQERNTYISRNELALVIDKIDKQTDALADRMLRIELGISNMQGRIAMSGIGLTILMFVIGIGARFLE